MCWFFSFRAAYHAGCVLENSEKWHLIHRKSPKSLHRRRKTPTFASQTKHILTMVEAVTNKASALSPFQIQMLELTSRVRSEGEMRDIRRMLAAYFAKRAEDEIDRLWDEGTLNEEVMEAWKTEHMRTPYRS